MTVIILNSSRYI